MLKHNQVKITTYNLEPESAINVITTILDLIDKNKIKIRYPTIHKGKNSIDFGGIISLLSPSITLSITIYNYIQSKRGVRDFSAAKGDSYEAYLPIIDRILEATAINPNAEATLITEDFSIKIREGGAQEPEPITAPSEILAANQIPYNGPKKFRSKICPICETRNDSDAIYCKHCGTKFE